VSVKIHGPGWTDVVKLPKKSGWRSFSLSPSKQSPGDNTREDSVEGGIKLVVRDSTVKVVHKALLEYGVGLRSGSPIRRAQSAPTVPPELSLSPGGGNQPKLEEEALNEAERAVSGSIWAEEIKKVRRESVIMTTTKPEHTKKQDDQGSEVSTNEKGNLAKQAKQAKTLKTKH
jgi:hypothetical protein